MINQPKQLPILQLTSYLVLVSFLFGCVGSPEKSIKPEDFSASSVKDILFQLRETSDNEMEKFSEKELSGVSSEISDRFRNAGYPIIDVNRSDYRPDAGGQIPIAAKDHFSHALEVSVGQSKRTKTPSGLSFTFGNSDPRSTDFQKALTVPVSCKLVSLDNEHPPIVLTERKTAVSDFEKMAVDQSRVHEKTKRFYIENIGATCHNLLVKLDIYPDHPVSEEKMKQLLPGVRIETTYKSDEIDADLKKSDTLDMKDESDERSSDTETAQLSVENDQSATGPSEPTSSFAKNIKTEKNQERDWRDQQITIFNQGDTVILKFGYERR